MEHLVRGTMEELVGAVLTIAGVVAVGLERQDRLNNHQPNRGTAALDQHHLFLGHPSLMLGAVVVVEQALEALELVVLAAAVMEGTIQRGLMELQILVVAVALLVLLAIPEQVIKAAAQVAAVS
jgi:hypothetical protein